MATVILKVTERCNSNCYYCDVVRKENGGTTMPLEILETVMVRIDEYLRGNQNERVEIIWHGGEPLMVGVDYLEAVHELQRRHCARTADRIRHSMQTNLTLFSEKFIAPLRNLGITALGTSFDPEPAVRGPGASIDTDWYNRRFVRGLALLDEHGFDWGMIYVVTKKSLVRPVDTFHLLTNLSLGAGINFNPVLIYDDQRTDIAITPREFVDFLGAIFPVWWKHRRRYGGVEPFRSLVETIINNRISLGCVDSGNCTYHHVNVAPNGQTSQCGRSADWGLLDYGNIADRPLDDILRDPKRAEIEERQRILQANDCAECRFWKLCHGGCPLDAWSQHNSFLHKSEWCDAKRGFISEYFEPITGVRYRPGNGGEEGVH